METPTRSLAKAVSWQVQGLLVMTALGYLHTGSLFAAASIAGSASLTGFVCFILHERAWSRVRWGTRIGTPNLRSEPEAS